MASEIVFLSIARGPIELELNVNALHFSPLAPMSYSANRPRAALLLVSAMWMLQIFALVLSAVAPQSDDYWQCVSKGYIVRLPAFATPAPDDEAPNGAMASHDAKQSVTTMSLAPHCRFVLVDPDGDALTPLVRTAFVAPHLDTIAVAAPRPLDVPLARDATLSAALRRGPPPSQTARAPFSLRAPPSV